MLLESYCFTTCSSVSEDWTTVKLDLPIQIAATCRVDDLPKYRILVTKIDSLGADRIIKLSDTLVPHLSQLEGKTRNLGNKWSLAQFHTAQNMD